MTRAGSKKPMGGDALRRRDVLQLSAALAAFGAGMGVVSGRAAEQKNQNAGSAGSKPKAGMAKGDTTFLKVKKDAGTKQAPKTDEKGSKK